VSVGVVCIDRSATKFTTVCDECGISFAGWLDPDLDRGTFLCRAGHTTLIVRAAPAAAETEAA